MGKVNCKKLVKEVVWFFLLPTLERALFACQFSAYLKSNFHATNLQTKLTCVGLKVAPGKSSATKNVHRDLNKEGLVRRDFL